MCIRDSSNTATVLRVINDKGENGWLEIPIDQLVPGDIIKLAAGDMIPADLRILQARDLFLSLIHISPTHGRCHGYHISDK